MIQRESCFVAVGGGQVVSCQVASEAALLDLANGMYYGLDTVGAAVWSLLEQPRTVEEILSALLLRFDVEPERCEQDLLALLGQLSEAKLVRPCTDAEQSPSLSLS